ncbi:hypothetical protein CYMTET_35292 [Cymbomonas tetramitiformis]|uniref:Uncharacterized protein n=1 Tax=Cymbomonas tetramitiformis TaxID=36881 RepID=A0AAE0KP43_9CHLO|nr:hypothetical protein CYMTET_35292 [Cymbomonas tetramitiformis]
MESLSVTGDPLTGALRFWEIITSPLTGMQLFSQGSHVTITFSDAALLVATFAIGGFLFGAFLVWSSYRATISRLSKKNIVHLADDLAKDPALLTQVLGELPSWLSFPEYDKVSWLNEAIARLWPHLDRAIMKKLREVLEPRLEQATPIFLKKIGLGELTLGSEPIQVTGAKYTSTQDDEVILELQIRWNSDLEAGLIIETPLNYASNLARVPVGVLGVQFFGCVRVTLKPLLPVVPGFGAITVAFMQAPYVDYELKGLGALVHLIPGVDTFLKGLVGNILKTTMVWPRRIVVPIIKGDYANLLPRPMGILELQVVSGIELSPENLVNFSSVPGLRLIPGLSIDPFVKLWMQGYNSKHTYRTSPCFSTSNPNFTNNAFRFVVEDMSTQHIELEVWNYVEMGVGNVTGGISELLPH